MLALVLLALPFIVSGLACPEFFNDLQSKLHNDDYDSLTPQQQLFIQASDKSAAENGLGNKDLCDNSPAMKYFVALRVYYKTLGFKTGINHGICIPLECEYLEKAPDQGLIAKIFEIKDWEIKEGEHLELYDPNTPISNKGFMFYFTCLLFASFFFVSVGSAIYISIKKKKEAKHANIHLDFHDLEHHAHKDAQAPQDSLHSSHHDIHETDHHHEENINQYKPHWLLNAFDIKDNFISLVKTATEHHADENIEVLDVLKVGTVFYVVYANAFSPYVKLLTNNESYEDFYKLVIAKLIQSADFTSEYFFVLVGFFTASKLLPHISKLPLNFKTYFRYFRQKLFIIWPVVFMSFLFFWQLIPQTYTGPMGYILKWEIESCNKVWWSKFLYIENLTNGSTIEGAGGYCIPTVWYMAAEFQVYALGILVLMIYLKHRKIGYALCVILYLQAFITAVVSFYKYDLSYEIVHPILYETKYKWLPWKRWSNFFLGSIFGMLYFEYNNLNKENIFTVFEKSRLISYLTMLLGFGFNMFLVFFLVSRDTVPSLWTEDLEHMWFGIRIVLTGVSIMMFFMPLAAHRNNIIKKFFLLRFFQAFSKYTSNLYIYHQGINYALYYSRTTDFTAFSHGAVCLQTVIVILIGGAVGTVTHLIIERPMMKLEAKLTEESTHYQPMVKDTGKTKESKFKPKFRRNEKILEIGEMGTNSLNFKNDKTDTTEVASPDLLHHAK